jgi:ABC-type uncharacterized transport system substrate-binding protein
MRLGQFPKYSGVVGGALLVFCLLLPVRGSTSTVEKSYDPLVIGIGFDVPRERAHFERYAQLVRTKRSSSFPEVRFEFFAVDVNDENEMRKVIPMVAGRYPSVVVAGNWVVARELQSREPKIPIVFLSMTEPTDVGLVEREGWPRMNATGVALSAPIVCSQLEWLLSIAAKRTHVTVVADHFWSATRNREDLISCMNKENVSYEIKVVRSRSEAQHLIATAAVKELDTWFFPAGNAVFVAESEWMDFVIRNSIVAAFVSDSWGDKAGIVTYQENRADFHEKMAEYIVAILAGRSASDMAVYRVSEMRLSLNLRRIRELGLFVSDEVLMQVDRVVQ